jgi:hypothetical protein
VVRCYKDGKAEFRIVCFFLKASKVPCFVIRARGWLESRRLADCFFSNPSQ